MLSGRTVVLRARPQDKRMNKLKFTYTMELDFSSPVSSHCFALYCLPGDSLRQKITLTEQTIAPADYLSRMTDGFGNIRISGCAAGPHQNFGYCIRGTALTEGMITEPGPLHPMYRYPSRYTQYEPEVSAFAAEADRYCLEKAAQTDLQKAVCVMEYLYTHFEYIPGATNIHTTAGEALRLGHGVCQDYAHIMTAVLRFLNIPARYVSGLMIGEGYTHAWVELYTDGGWYGLDPTNNLHIDGYYIKLAHGRDYGDCPVDKGCFLGNVSQEQRIYVNVEETKND